MRLHLWNHHDDPNLSQLRHLITEADIATARGVTSVMDRAAIGEMDDTAAAELGNIDRQRSYRRSLPNLP